MKLDLASMSLITCGHWPLFLLLITACYTVSSRGAVLSGTFLPLSHAYHISLPERDVVSVILLDLDVLAGGLYTTKK